MQSETVAKVVAYKAYRLGRDALAQGRSREMADLACRCLTRLEQQAATPEVLSRRLFYNLVLAELNRASDPVPYRERAADLGEKLQAMKQHSSFAHYMQIVAATDAGAYTTGNFGDITTSGSAESVRPTETYTDFSGNIHHVDLALATLEMSARDLKRQARFLAMTLDEIAKGNGLVPE